MTRQGKTITVDAGIERCINVQIAAIVVCAQMALQLEDDEMVDQEVLPSEQDKWITGAVTIAALLTSQIIRELKLTKSGVQALVRMMSGRVEEVKP